MGYRETKLKRQAEIPRLRKFIEKLPLGTILKFRGTSNHLNLRELVQLSGCGTKVVGLQVRNEISWVGGKPKTTGNWVRTGIASINGIENFEGYYTKMKVFIDRKTILADYETLRITEAEE